MKKLLISLALLFFPVLALASPDSVGPFVNASPTTITTGGTWQVLFKANSNRSTLWVENPCSATTQGIVTAESLFLGYGSPAPTSTTTGGVVELAACGSLVMPGGYVTQQEIWVFAATSSHAFYAAQTQ